MRTLSAVFGTLIGVASITIWMGCAQQSGVTTNGTEVSRNGCSVDLKEICDALMGQMAHTDFTVNQEKYDARSFEQNRPPHDDVLLSYNYPDGTLLASVRCQFDTVHHKITSATLASGPPIDDKAINYIRSQGFCGESLDDGSATNAAKPASPSEQH